MNLSHSFCVKLTMSKMKKTAMTRTANQGVTVWTYCLTEETVAKIIAITNEMKMLMPQFSPRIFDFASRA